MAKTKDLNRDLGYYQRELEKKIAIEAAKNKELSIHSGHTDEKGDTDTNAKNARRHQKAIKLMAKHHKTVSYEDIKDVAYRLSIRFRVLRIELSALFKVSLPHQIFQENSYRNEINFITIVEILGRRPFDLKRPEENGMLAKYLVEDNQEESVEFSVNNYNNVGIVCSILKFLLGPYEVYNETKNIEIKETLKLVILFKADFPTSKRQNF